MKKNDDKNVYANEETENEVDANKENTSKAKAKKATDSAKKKAKGNDSKETDSAKKAKESDSKEADSKKKKAKKSDSKETDSLENVDIENDEEENVDTENDSKANENEENDEKVKSEKKVDDDDDNFMKGAIISALFTALFCLLVLLLSLPPIILLVPVVLSIVIVIAVWVQKHYKTKSKDETNQEGNNPDRRKSILFGGIIVVAILAIIVGAFFVLRGPRSLSNDYIIIHQYRGLQITQVEEIEITDEHVEGTIQQTLQHHMENIEITDRPAQEGDLVTIDFAGSIDGEYFEGGTAEGTQLHLGSMSFIGPEGDYAGFEEQIEGHNVGDNFDIQIKFPEHYHAEHLAGEVANFNITLHAIIVQVIPELTDEWVQEVSDVSTTVEEYREEIREQLAENQRLSILNQHRSEVLGALFQEIEIIELPQDLVEAEFATQMDAFRAEAASHGIEFEDYLAQVFQIDEATFIVGLEHMVEETIVVRLALDLIIQRERLDVSEGAIAAKIEELAEQNRMTVEELHERIDENELEEIVRQLIVAEFLVRHAVEVTPEEQAMQEMMIDQ